MRAILAVSAHERQGVMDPEIEAMASVSSALGGLEPDAQARVLRWAGERYGVAIRPGKAADRNGASEGAGERDETSDLTDDEIAAEAPDFGHFAELFAAAQPKTNEDKA